MLNSKTLAGRSANLLLIITKKQTPNTEVATPRWLPRCRHFRVRRCAASPDLDTTETQEHSPDLKGFLCQRPYRNGSQMTWVIGYREVAVDRYTATETQTLK